MQYVITQYITIVIILICYTRLHCKRITNAGCTLRNPLKIFPIVMEDDRNDKLNNDNYEMQK